MEQWPTVHGLSTKALVSTKPVSTSSGRGLEDTNTTGFQANQEMNMDIKQLIKLLIFSVNTDSLHG